MLSISVLNHLLSHIPILEIYLNIFYKLLWRFAPSVLQITGTISLREFSIAFRPLVPSDRHVIDPNFEKDIRVNFQPRINQIVIDVGAHIGLCTLMASRKVGRNGKVISIEPDESNLVFLRKNIILNDFGNVMGLTDWVRQYQWSTSVLCRYNVNRVQFQSGAFMDALQSKSNR